MQIIAHGSSLPILNDNELNLGSDIPDQGSFNLTFPYTRSNISNTRKSFSSGEPNTAKWIEKRGAAEFFFMPLRGVSISR